MARFCAHTTETGHALVQPRPLTLPASLPSGIDARGEGRGQGVTRARVDQLRAVDEPRAAERHADDARPAARDRARRDEREAVARRWPRSGTRASWGSRSSARAAASSTRCSSSPAHACGLGRVEHQENRPEATDCVIVELACSLVGHEVGVRVEAGTLAESVLGSDRVVERYLCAYGPAGRYLDTLQAHGLVFSGRDEAGDVRIAELPGHPFFLATLFQPELSGDGSRAHPIVRAFAAAAADRAAHRDEFAAAAGSKAA